MFNLFKKRIKVTFIEALDNEEIDRVKLLPEQLPQSFKKATTMHIGDKDWQVVKAEPEDAADFHKSGRLTLWIKPVVTIHPSSIRYSIPTISAQLPGTTQATLFNEFTSTLHEDDWRQIEFLPLALLPLVQQEMADIEAILFPEDDPDFDSLDGFDKLHVRQRIGQHHLSIPLEEFCEVAGIVRRGNIAVQNHLGYVENGFALKGKHYTWYGIAEDGVIKDLALIYFDSMDDELMSLLQRYDLILVEWCRGSITAG